MQQQGNYFNTIGYFNFARGICILFVILGHTITLFFDGTIGTGFGANWSENLGAGLMAMLFMVSGFGFRHKSNWKCIKQQAKLCLLPYVITAGCVIGAKLVLAVLKHRSFWKYGGEFLSTYLFCINRGYQGKIWGMYVDNIAWTWFLWALFGGWILYNAIVGLEDERVQALLVAVCVIIGMSLTLVSKVWFYCIPHMFQTTGFLYVGNMIQKHNLLEKKLSPIIWGAIIVLAGIAFFCGGVDMFTCIWNLFILDYIGTLAEGFLLMKFFAYIADKEPENIIYDNISTIGYHTLLLLCIHTFDSRVIPWHRAVEIFAGKEIFGTLLCLAIRFTFAYVAYVVVTKINKKFFRKKTKHKKIKLQIEK